MQIAKQDILDQINSLLGDNQTRDITPQRLRDVFGSVLDSYVHKDEVTAGGSSAMRFIPVPGNVQTSIIGGTIPIGSYGIISNTDVETALVEMQDVVWINGLDMTGRNILDILPGEAVMVWQKNQAEIIVHKLGDQRIAI
jgi:hypothetical protein